MSEPFWETTPLHQMSRDQWESLCDGCAKCCLVQLEDEETQQLVLTDLACNLLDTKTCRCTDYKNRSKRVPTCMTLTVENLEAVLEFAPNTCAYRLIHEGSPLPDWHPLVCGKQITVHQSGNSVRDKVIHERLVSELEYEDHVIEWS